MDTQATSRSRSCGRNRQKSQHFYNSSTHSYHGSAPDQQNEHMTAQQRSLGTPSFSNLATNTDKDTYRV